MRPGDTPGPCGALRSSRPSQPRRPSRPDQPIRSLRPNWPRGEDDVVGAEEPADIGGAAGRDSRGEGDGDDAADDEGGYGGYLR